MRSMTSADIYDENSVFNKFLSDEKPVRKPTESERLAKVFADAPHAAGPIDVADFLPVY